MTDQIIAFDYGDQNPERLDKILVAHLSAYSRARLQGLIKEGFVTVDGLTVTKTGQQIEAPARVKVRIPPAIPSELVPESIPLDIVYEDDNLIVVNKPAGMVVHPSIGHDSGTLVHAALAYAPEMEGIGGEKRPGVVHRLDKDTSGLILLAKNDNAHRWLQDQFRERRVDKYYLALVDGKPPTPTGRIEAPVGRDSAKRRQMAIVVPRKGRAAFSEYRTVESFSQHTLLEVHPITGRTHQIRLHLDFIGCPITGDTIYGRRKPTVPITRHFLHAARLSLRLPGKDILSTFEAPLPQDLESVLIHLRERD